MNNSSKQLLKAWFLAVVSVECKATLSGIQRKPAFLGQRMVREKEINMALHIGDSVDHFTFLRSDGSSVALSEFGDKILVLIFLRHLG